MNRKYSNRSQANKSRKQMELESQWRVERTYYIPQPIKSFFLGPKGRNAKYLTKKYGVYVHIDWNLPILKVTAPSDYHADALEKVIIEKRPVNKKDMAEAGISWVKDVFGEEPKRMDDHNINAKSKKNRKQENKTEAIPIREVPPKTEEDSIKDIQCTEVSKQVDNTETEEGSIKDVQCTEICKQVDNTKTDEDSIKDVQCTEICKQVDNTKTDEDSIKDVQCTEICKHMDNTETEEERQQMKDNETNVESEDTNLNQTLPQYWYPIGNNTYRCVVNFIVGSQYKEFYIDCDDAEEMNNISSTGRLPDYAVDAVYRYMTKLYEANTVIPNCNNNERDEKDYISSSEDNDTVDGDKVDCAGDDDNHIDHTITNGNDDSERNGKVDKEWEGNDDGTVRDKVDNADSDKNEDSDAGDSRRNDDGDASDVFKDRDDAVKNNEDQDESGQKIKSLIRFLLLLMTLSIVAAVAMCTIIFYVSVIPTTLAEVEQCHKLTQEAEEAHHHKYRYRFYYNQLMDCIDMDFLKMQIPPVEYSECEFTYPWLTPYVW